VKALIVPDMVTDRVKKDYQRIFQIPLANPKMDDDRRSIHEEDDEAAGTSTQAFLVKMNGLPLGNHFHTKKIEMFYILEGEVEHLITADPASSNTTNDRANIPAGSLIVMPPGVAHTFFLTPGSRMICYASERFDPDDMVAYKLA